MGRQIVLFGGTFDPVHFGHLITARAVAERFQFERVTLVPAALPPHKGGPRTVPEHRLAMLQLATRGDPLFDICRLELDRTGPSYTIQTVEALRGSGGRDCPCRLIIGTDMLEGLASWHRAEELLESVEIVVAARPPWHGRLEELLATLSGALGEERIERIRQMAVSTPLIDISSSQIRQRLAQRLPIRYLAPDAVVAYIEQHNLYG